jgi:hypothetical protein
VYEGICEIFRDIKGKSIYDDLAKELGATKIEANLLRFKVDGAHTHLGRTLPAPARASTLSIFSLKLLSTSQAI